MYIWQEILTAYRVNINDLTALRIVFHYLTETKRTLSGIIRSYCSIGFLSHSFKLQLQKFLDLEGWSANISSY